MGLYLQSIKLRWETKEIWNLNVMLSRTWCNAERLVTITELWTFSLVMLTLYKYNTNRDILKPFVHSFIHTFIHTSKQTWNINHVKVLYSTKVVLLKAQSQDGRTHIFEEYILKIKEHRK